MSAVRRIFEVVSAAAASAAASASARDAARDRWAGEYRDIDDGPAFDPEDRLNEDYQLDLCAPLRAVR